MVSSISTSHLKSTLTDRQISRTNKNMTSMSKFTTMRSGMTLVLKNKHPRTIFTDQCPAIAAARRQEHITPGELKERNNPN
ncbi:hypothetical protein LINPERHAP1_LOCUS17447, partial [Linum perenne]